MSMFLDSTSDIIQLITGSASTINVHASYADNSSGTVTPADANVATISTATTTTIVASPGSSIQRSVRNLTIKNADATNNCACTVQHYDGTTTSPLIKCTLLAGETLMYTGEVWVHYDINGGIYSAVATNPETYNTSTTSQGAGFSSDTYLTGSNVLLPSSRPKVGTLYRCRFHISKTAAGTATPIISLRYGTAATTSDTAICTFTFAAGTAAADVGWWEVVGLFRTVGSGTNAVVAGCTNLTSNLTTTGFSNAVKVVQNTSSGFDSTTANTYLGVSVNGGASASWTVQLVQTTLEAY